MASCEEEAQKARRPVVLSINKLAKGSSHHGPVQLGTGRRIKIVGTPLSKLSLHHRPFRASSSSFTIFESSPLWLPRNQRAPSGLSFADLRSLLSFSLHRFLFFLSLFLNGHYPEDSPPLPRSFDTEPVFTNDFNVREARNRKLPIYAIVTGRTGLFQGEYVHAVSFLSSFMEEACCCKSFRLEI